MFQIGPHKNHITYFFLNPACLTTVKGYQTLYKYEICQILCIDKSI